MTDGIFNYEYWGNNVLPSKFNMAVEEYMLKRVAEKRKTSPTATVRFYSFPQDSIVLGYAQATDAVKKLDQNVELTRRITGGSHVQTGRNTIAYSFVVPRDGSFHDFEDMRAYYAQCVANALTGIGIDGITVDNKASTINVNGRIIASHAMFWGVESALLHGLLMLQPYDVEKIAGRVFLQQRKIGNSVYLESDALRNLATVSTELDGTNHRANTVMKPHVLRKLVGDAILENATGNKYTNQQIDDSVLARSNELFKKRYGEPLWINEHEPTFTPEEVEAIPGEELDGPLKQRLGYCLFIQVPDKDFKKMASLSE